MFNSVIPPTMLYSSSNTSRDKYESVRDLFGRSLLCSYKGTLKLFFATTLMKKKICSVGGECYALSRCCLQLLSSCPVKFCSLVIYIKPSKVSVHIIGFILLKSCMTFPESYSLIIPQIVHEIHLSPALK